MKSPSYRASREVWTPSRPLTASSLATGGLQLSARSAFTLVEIMVASSIGLLVIAGAMTFLQFANISLSGTIAQTGMNQQAGNAIEFIQSRVRLATSVSNDASGNVLTMSFDDNPVVDSDGDGIPYNDKDHYEQFQFLGLNGDTNATATNRLIYILNTASPANQQVLIPSGVRNLPGYNIFTVTNKSTVIVRFGVVDTYTFDHYHSIDIQATAVPLNRPAQTSFISILP